DAKLVASEDDKGLVLVWDASSGETKAELSGNDGATHLLAFSPDGTTLATVATIEETSGRIGRNKIVLWDTVKWEIRGELQGHTFEIAAFAFHPREGVLISASEAGRVDEMRCWDLACLKELFGFHYSTVPHSHCHSLRFSPDGNILVCGTSWEDICI